MGGREHCQSDREPPQRRLAPEDTSEHPPPGRVENVIDFREHAERYLVPIECGPPSNYSAWSPDLLGCVATGETLDGCEREMREAIAFHLEGLVEQGESIPEPSGPGV
jgi:predicted RNase H-like HicB family nuclease